MSSEDSAELLENVSFEEEEDDDDDDDDDSSDDVSRDLGDEGDVMEATSGWSPTVFSSSTEGASSSGRDEEDPFSDERNRGELANWGELREKVIGYWREIVPQVFHFTPSSILSPPVMDELVEKRLLRPLEWFIFGGDPDTELKRIKNGDQPPELCGKVFKNGEPTYSCRDCGMDPTCVLCIDCFNKSAHKKHRYRMASSGGGGYCDCGDVEAWKRDAFCDYHLKGSVAAASGEATAVTKGNLSQDVQDRCDAMLGICFDYCHSLLFWEGADEVPSLIASAVSKRPNDEFLTMLYNDEVHTYIQVTDALQRACGVTEKQATEHAARVDREGRSPVRIGTQEDCLAVKQDIQKRSTQTLHGPRKPLKVEVCQASVAGHQAFAQALLGWFVGLGSKGGPAIRHRISQVLMRQQISGLTFAERFILGETQLWKSVRSQLHQLFMATVLMETSFKKSFSSLFARHYRKIQRDFIDDDHEHALSVTSLSVQIFTVPTISKMLVSEANLLHTLFNTFWREMESKVNHDGMLTFGRPPRGNPSDQQSFRRANFVLMDPKYVLTTPPTVDEWKNQKLRDNFQSGLEVLLQILAAMQGMDPVTRQVEHHIEFEPEWETAFNLQLKLQNVLSQIIAWTAAATDNSDVLLRAFRATVDVLYKRNPHRTLRRVPITLARHIFLAIEYDVSKSPISVHLPLTRLLAGLYLHLGKFGLTYYSPELMMSQTTPHPHRLDPIDLMEHPLRVIVMVAQSYAGMWRRNGYALLNQIYLYQNVRCRGEMFDRDVQVLQICASLLDPKEFLIQVVNRFGLLNWLKDEDDVDSSARRKSKEKLADKKADKDDDDEGGEARMKRDIADEMLALLIVVLSERWVPGIGQVTPTQCVRREVLHSLCTGPKTHSEMLKTLAEDANHETGLESVVDSVADFNRSTKKYQLKDDCLKDFSLFYYHYSRSEQTKAEEEVRKRLRTLDDSSSSSPPPMPPPLPPPFVPTLAPIVRLADSDVMMLLLRTIVVRALIDSSPKTFSETHLLMALHLIGLSLHEESRCLESDDLSFQFLTKSHEIDWMPEGAETRASPSKEAAPSLSSSTSSLSSLSSSSSSLSAALERLASDSRYDTLRLLIGGTKRQLTAVSKVWKQKSAIQNETSASDGNSASSDDKREETLSEEKENEEEEEEEESVDEVASRREKEERKKKAKALANERRAKIMAQMASMQRAFIAENKEQFDLTSTSESESPMIDAESSSQPTEERFPIGVGPNKTKLPAPQGPPRVETCILCQEDEEVTSSSICYSSSFSSPPSGRSGIVVMAALAQRSNVLAANARPKNGAPSTADDVAMDDDSSNFCSSLGASASSSSSVLGAVAASSSSAIASSSRRRGFNPSTPSFLESPSSSDESASGSEPFLPHVVLKDDEDGDGVSRKDGEEEPLFTRASLASGTHLSSCGHVMHAECWQRFFDAVLQRESRRRQRYVSSYDVEKHCFLCPLCESLSNAAIPVFPPWTSERRNAAAADDDDMDNNDDDGDKGDDDSTTDLARWIDRLRLLINSSFRLVEKKKKAVAAGKGAGSKRRLTSVGSADGGASATTTAAGAAAAASLDAATAAAAATRATMRRLHTAGATATMTPAEILGAILTSVGVGAAGGGALRRRSTSSPETTTSTSSEGMAEEEEENAKGEMTWELSSISLDEALLKGEFSTAVWRRFLRLWQTPGRYETGRDDEVVSLHPTGLLMLQNVARSVYTVGLESMPDDENQRMTTSLRTAAAYTIKAIESTLRCQESGIVVGSEGAFRRNFGFSSSMISTATKPDDDSGGGSGSGSDIDGISAAGKSGGAGDSGGAGEGGGLGLSSRQLDWLRVMVRAAASASCVAPPEITRNQALRLAACVVPGVGEGESTLESNEGSVLRSTSALLLDPFVSLVNLVYALPLLISSEASGGSGISAGPHLPSGGANDHLLLRLFASLQLAQLLLRYGGGKGGGGRVSASGGDKEAEGSAYFTVDSDSIDFMDVDVGAGAGGGDESDDLMRYWKELRRESCLSTELPSSYSAANLSQSICNDFLPFLRCCSLFFHLLTEVPMPISAAASATCHRELQLLLKYLDLPLKLSSILHDANGDIFPWIRFWCRTFSRSASTSAVARRNQRSEPVSFIMSPSAPLCPRRFIPLPADYSDVINRAASFVCPNAASASASAASINESRAPVICLLCGAMLCSSQTLCCQEELSEGGGTVGPCVAHVKKCGAGVGVLLQVAKCQIILLAGQDRGCFYPPPYVDAYGETDQGLRRGNPLFLCQESYARLENLWLNHCIPQTIVRVLEANTNFMAINWNLW